MEPKYLEHLVSTNPESTAVSDTNEPFSYLEWKRRIPTIVEEHSTQFYNKYLVEWFNRNKQQKISQKFLIRQRYLYLLDQLQLFFKEEEKNFWYSKINLSDEKDLLLSIPYFAKKLKNIALYYLKLRKRLKNTKLKYNLVGTATGMEQEIYNLLLKTFTDFNEELSPEMAVLTPTLSSIKDSLVVKINETYDDFDYFDKSPSLSSNYYYDLSHEVTSNYFKTKNIELSSSDWLFRSLTLNPTQTYFTFLSAITGELLEITNQETYEGFFKNYLSENKYTETFFTVSTSANVFEITIEPGNNNFYYPYGTIDKSSTNNLSIETVNLSSLQIEGSTSGTTPQDSDIITVKNGTEYQSAWCYYKQFEDVNEIMSATLQGNGSTKFRFPYPGYGLSGQNVEWTGMGTSTNSEYFFFKSDVKNAIDAAYWSAPLPAASIDSIYINDTALLSSNATSSKNPYLADKIILETNDEKDLEKPTIAGAAAWLYYFDKTCWPIANDKPNTFLWPLHLAPTADQYSNSIVNNFCDPISIHDLNTNLSIGASSIDLSDKIYKVTNVGDPINVATECCWLSSTTTDSGNYRIIAQDGFSSIFWPDSITRFIWTGPTTPLSAVFSNKVHKKECPFSTNIPKLSSSTSWNQCTCKQVFHAPFGHPGKTFVSYEQQADFIAIDKTDTFQPFSYDTWTDSSGNGFLNSTEFVWFKTESVVGWGSGRWVTTNTSTSVLPFNLEYGKAYFYGRRGSRTSEQHPFYSVNYSFPTSKKAKWIGAVKNEEGKWISSNTPSTFTLRSGDFLKYERQNTTTNYFITSELVEDQSENRGSVWSTLDYVVSGSYQDTTYLMWPTQNKPLNSSDPQYPPFDVLSLSALHFWEIQSNEYPALSTRIYSTYETLATSTITSNGSGGFVATPKVEKIYKNKTMIAFTPPVTGTYSIRVSANNQWFTTIPNLTVVPQYKQVEKLLNIDVPTSGFVLEQDLYGWNYTRNKSQKGAKGAKPYWAELYINRQAENRYKATRFWGYPNNYVDGYLPDQSPQFSLMEINFGDVVSYEHIGYELQWNQPIVFKTFSGVSQWCVLSSYPITDQINRQAIDLEAYGTYEPTSIKLSNLLNGLPVEISYDSLNSFTWKISTYDTSSENTNKNSLLYSKNSNYVNLENRFFSTIAVVPTLEKNYTEETVGGYFLPQNIGASQYINDNFNVSLKTTLSSGTVITEDTSIHVGGRGRSKQDQSTLYKWTEQNEWMKSEPIAEQKAGSVKNELTKTLQTFIPYQPGSEIISLGLTTEQTKTSPWGGLQDSQWTDYSNNPASFTDVLNVSAWTTTQIFKNQELSLDQWTSDIFGNQYGLYKNLSGIQVADYSKTHGQLWTRLNDQTVAPAIVSLSAALGVLKTKTFYSELTSNQIKTIDCFLDTLFIETETTVGLIPIDYDYSNSVVSILLDNVALLENLNDRVKRFEKTWFFPTQKQVVLLTTEINSYSFVPTLYVFDLTNKSFNKVFPLTIEDNQRVQQGLSGINVFSIDTALLHYNSTYQTFLINYKGINTNAEMFIVDFEIEQKDKMTLQKVDRYLQDSSATTALYPPLITNSLLLTPQTINTGVTFAVSIPALYSPTSYNIINTTAGLSAVTVTATGTFTGIANATGYHQINYVISNSAGSTPYTLTLLAI